MRSRRRRRRSRRRSTNMVYKVKIFLKNSNAAADDAVNENADNSDVDIYVRCTVIVNILR
jgi:hypothetical protein